MADYGHELRFGVFLTPSAAQAGDVLELASLADLVGLDLVTFQDHPYQPAFLDTWTLLSVVAAHTSSVTLAPNVANVPLRPPVVLARSVATLDILSGGRVELGLGAGAFLDAIASVGGPRLTPGSSVDALSEAIDVIRAVWRGDAASLHLAGDHYRIDGAQPGPPPAHAVEIWLGAYKPRMLALTGTKADGWLPSMGYAPVDALPPLNAAIDAAAEAAGRSPSEIRRLYNLNGRFGRGPGMLEGAPSEWAKQLAELTLTQGMSAYILAVAAPDDLRRFANEVAPAVRELVDQGRAAPTSAPEREDGTVRLDAAAASPFAVVPTPDDGARLSGEAVWDEAGRPTGPVPEPDRRYTAEQQAAGQHLVDVHDGLRAEVARIRDLIDQVARGEVDPARVQTLINRMTIRQNNWTLGVYCQSYCRAVSGHHTLEDRGIFPHLEHRDPRLEPVLHRLEEEHEVIAELLDRIDDSLTALVAAEPEAMTRLRASIDVLTDAMLSHLSYEERELVEPLAAYGFA